MTKPMAVVIHYLTSGESWQMASEYSRRCYQAGLPVYHSIAGAAKAIDRLVKLRHTGDLALSARPPSVDA
ncbi:MAG: hypothetical protein NTU41_03520 [Chloroflexi bacterium]|nr:hypothetical protein [Chloroflexota bacterium]